MISRGVAHIILALVLMTTLTAGIVLHAMIPHKHSHNGEPTSAIWDSLHSALRGEDKKLLEAMANSFVSFTSFILLVLILNIGRMLLAIHSSPTKHPDDLDLALQKGILAYRAFG